MFYNKAGIWKKERKRMEERWWWWWEFLSNAPSQWAQLPVHTQTRGWNRGKTANDSLSPTLSKTQPFGVLVKKLTTWKEAVGKSNMVKLAMRSPR